MRHIVAAITLASFCAAVGLAYELGDQHARISATANRCPQYAGGEPLVTAIYHVDGSVACHYSIPRRRMIRFVVPRPD